MRTTWTDWKPDSMRDAAASEARAGFDALKARKRYFLAPLPYYGAYAAYEGHVAGCPVCQQDEFTDCPEGAELLIVARTGITEQADLALSN